MEVRLDPWQADAGLMFERAEIQMIRWMCGVSINTERQVNN